MNNLLAEEELRKKYRVLRGHLSSIRNELIELDSSFQEIINLLGETLVVDEQIVEKDKIDAIQNLQHDIFTLLDQEIIPSISNRC